ncbi:hypothetical protein D3C71_2084570 [compost metagenome]
MCSPLRTRDSDRLPHTLLPSLRSIQTSRLVPTILSTPVRRLALTSSSCCDWIICGTSIFTLWPSTSLRS